MIAGGIAVVLALPVAVALAMRVRVPVVLAVLPVGLVPLVAAVLGQRNLQAPDLSAVPVTDWHTTTALALAAGLEPLSLTGSAAFPAAALVLLGCAVAALRSKSKHVGSALPGVALIAVLVAGVVRDFLLDLDPREPPLYLVVLVPLGLLACVGMLGADDEGNSAEAAGAAGISFTLLTAALAIGESTRVAGMVYGVVGSASAEMQSGMRLSGLELLIQLDVRGWASLLWASALGLLGLGRSLTPPGLRRYASAGASLWLPLGLLAYGLTTPEPGWSEAQRQVWQATQRHPSEDFQLPAFDVQLPAQLNTTLLAGLDRLDLDGKLVAVASGDVPLDAEAQRALQQAIEARLPTKEPRRLDLAVDRRYTWAQVEALVAAGRRAGFDSLGAIVLSREVGRGVILFRPASVAPPPHPDLPEAMPVIEVLAQGWRVHHEGGTIDVPCAAAGCEGDEPRLHEQLGRIKDLVWRQDACVLVPDPALPWEQTVRTMHAVMQDPEKLIDQIPRELFYSIYVGDRGSIPPEPADEATLDAPNED